MYSYNSHSEKKAARTISIVSGLLFTIFSLVFLSVNFRYLLSAAEDHSLFVYSSSFLLDKISQPGGILVYLTGFLVQFFHNPWIGGLIITGLLLFVRWLVYKSFDFNKKYFVLSYIPSFLLLIAMTNVGRSFYGMTHTESMFTYLPGMVILLLSYFLFSRIKDSKESIITICWLFPLLFFVLSGSYAIYFFVFILLCRNSSARDQNKTLIYLICIGLYLLSFLLAKFVFYPHATGSQVLFGVYPAIPVGHSEKSLLPHLLLAGFFLLVVVKRLFFPFGNRIISYARWTYTNLIWFLVFCAATACLANTNEDFRDEMAIDNSIQQGDFDRALKVGKDAMHPTREMTILRNFALVLSGKAGEKMFEYTQDYKSDGLFFDYTKGGVSYPAGTMIYFNLGAKHIASEWTNNDYLNRPDSYRTLKNYALIATMNGHLNATKSAASILGNTQYHQDLAKELDQFSADNSLVSKDSVLGDIKKRQSDKYFEIPAKGKYADFICHFYRSNIDNKVAYDYYMMSALLNKKLDKFAWGVKLYKLFYKNPLPKHYAEASALCNYLHVGPVLYVNASTKKAFDGFLKLKKAQKNPATEKNIMRRNYGQTFWWYYFYK